MTDIAPRTLVDGRYRIEERIGSGGMADVFRAEDLQLGRQVALKLLLRRFADDAEFVERFRREARSAAGLQHPNVVGVYDRGEWDGTYYIAMEYLPGRTLRELIRAEAPLHPLRAIDLTAQILKAARFAHRRGVIHRDLKPLNVIVDDEDRVKVTDFGIARAGASDMTETGSILGTARYLSPEQAQGHAVSPCSDVYAVGVILYEMLTGRVPFEGDSAVAIAVQHVAGAPESPSRLNPAVPPELETLVLWALEKEPARRPADADAFLAALGEAREHILARDRGEHTAAFGALGAHDGAAAPATGEEVAPPPPPPAAPPGRRRRRWPWLAALLPLLLAGGAAAWVLTRPATADVPKVVGQSLTVAKTRLQNDGFEVNAIGVTSPRPNQQVIAQTPLPGERVKEGELVTLTYSTGPGQAQIPDVAGLSRAAAQRRLHAAGFKVRTRTERSGSVASGRAIRTSPPSGSQIDKGRTVTLVMSSGPPLVAVPGVVGDDRATATAELQAAGLTVGVAERTSTGRAPGTVLAQDPGGGASVAQGTRVTITVAKQGNLKVPGVVGRTADDAANALADAGFLPRIVTGKASKPDQDGKVIRQSPPGGSVRPKGSRVTITVGQFQAQPNPNEQPGATSTNTTPSPNTTTTTTPSAGGGGP